MHYNPRHGDDMLHSIRNALALSLWQDYNKTAMPVKGKLGPLSGCRRWKLLFFSVDLERDNRSFGDVTRLSYTDWVFILIEEVGQLRAHSAVTHVAVVKGVVRKLLQVENSTIC
ncbi:hypothetical protein JTE90_011608 [Oedothorax gibbosus]|uniref:Uncharacterized protein n=1 Tax=Oedothorax gibbosus TaxID=931172 RepID=A0AAV6U387_9ARAC|nr:hypothetical protein JTE90_011608 [Oedothorax gibbosus]